MQPAVLAPVARGRVSAALLTIQSLRKVSLVDVPVVEISRGSKLADLMSVYLRSNRSRFITLVQAATKWATNFFCPSELP